MTMTRFEIRNTIKQSKLGWRGRIQAQYTNVLRTENNQSRGWGAVGWGQKPFITARKRRCRPHLDADQLRCRPPRYDQQVDGTHPTGMHTCYHPQMRLQKGNVFTRVCQEFCPQGRGCVSQHALGTGQGGCVSQHALGRGVCIPACTGGVCLGVSAKRGVPSGPEADTPRDGHPLPDGHCSGRYASYWNAFLFGMIFAETCM